jgi:HSP20 family protein
MRSNVPNRVLGLVGELSGTAHAEGPWQPSADVYRTRDGWLVKFELAGVRPEEIDLRLGGARLRLRGLRRDVVCRETQQSHSMEISYNQFERNIEFPESLDAYATDTQYQDGMLLVWLRKKT